MFLSYVLLLPMCVLLYLLHLAVTGYLFCSSSSSTSTREANKSDDRVVPKNYLAKCRAEDDEQQQQRLLVNGSVQFAKQST